MRPAPPVLKQHNVAPSPVAFTAWPNPSALSFGSDDDVDDPTLTPASLARHRPPHVVTSGLSSSAQRIPSSSSTASSHTPELEAPSRRPGGAHYDHHGWRSPTPSLSSDLGGLTTSTETEIDTDGGGSADDDLDAAMTETELEGNAVDDHLARRKRRSRLARRLDSSDLPPDLLGLGVSIDTSTTPVRRRLPAAALPFGTSPPTTATVIPLHAHVHRHHHIIIIISSSSSSRRHNSRSTLLMWSWMPIRHLRLHAHEPV